jgi:hypothetical protein
MGYSLQANRKDFEGKSHPDRNQQFKHIQKKVRDHISTGDPVISVDTKRRARWKLQISRGLVQPG